MAAKIQFGKWGYVGWFPSEDVLLNAFPAEKNRGNWASVGGSETLTFYYSNGYIWSPGGGTLGHRTIPPTVSTTEFAHSVTQEGTPISSDSPVGRGLAFELPPGEIDVGTIDLPPGNSMFGDTSGTSLLTFAKHKTVTAETGVIKPLDVKYSKRGFAGRGYFSRFNIDGQRDDPNITAFPVHGIYYTEPTDKGPTDDSADGGDVHFMEEVVIGKCTGSGVKVVGRDQFSGIRMRSNDNARYGYELIDMNDSKMFAPGANGNLLGALYLEHTATPKFYGFDFGNPNSGFIGPWTVTLVNQARAGFFGGEIQGRIGIVGRNANATNRWEMTGNVFHGTNFKIDGNLSPSYTYNSSTISAQIYVENCDGLSFSACKLQYNNNQPSAGDLAATPDYFIYVNGNGASNYAGAIRFSNMSCLAHRRSRPGDALPSLVAFKKNVCNIPQKIEWDFAPGELVLMKYNGGVVPDNYVLAGPFGGAAATYNKADYPFGFLWATGLNLDNVATTFNVPVEPYNPPAGYRFMMRVWP